MKPGDEVIGLDGRTYVAEVSPSVVLGLDLLPCADCDLHPLNCKDSSCRWEGKEFTCSQYTDDKLYFKLKE